MIQQIILIDTGIYCNDSLYYRYTLGMTFNKLDSWEWVHQPYFRMFRTYDDCMSLGVL